VADVADVGPNNNITQLYSGEGGEEVLVAKAKCVDAKLLINASSRLRF
jgi:hypothetical protein